MCDENGSDTPPTCILWPATSAPGIRIGLCDLAITPPTDDEIRFGVKLAWKLLAVIPSKVLPWSSRQSVSNGQHVCVRLVRNKTKILHVNPVSMLIMSSATHTSTCCSGVQQRGTCEVALDQPRGSDSFMP